MRKTALLFLLAGWLLGCSSQPTPSETKPEAPAEKPAEYATGRVAMQKLYATARGWAVDAQPVGLRSSYSQDAPVGEGKAGVWRASFASAARRGLRPYLWSGLSAADAPERGINPGTEDSFNPANPSTRPFDINFLKVDSDKAVAVAQGKGGKALTDKDPAQPIVFSLEWNPRSNSLVWLVIYGHSEHDAKLQVAVDATTGEFIRTVK